MMMDRYDELMLGLYRGDVPPWLPEASREGYLRESLRRRCALGQTLIASWPCTMFAARSMLSFDPASEAFTAWPAERCRARNVTTGLYNVLDDMLESEATLWELLQYESMVVRDLLCPLGMPHTHRGDAEVYRFAHRVQEFHARMNLYLSAGAPASFVREYHVVAEPTVLARRRRGDRWVVIDVTEEE
jgi:hypothetical protein